MVSRREGCEASPFSPGLRLRGGYRDSDVVRHYVLVMTPAPKGVDEHELLRTLQVLFCTRLLSHLPCPPRSPACSSYCSPSSFTSCPYCPSNPRIVLLISRLLRTKLKPSLRAPRRLRRKPRAPAALEQIMLRQT